MFAEASLIEHNLNLPELTTSLDGLSKLLRNYLSQDAIHCVNSICGHQYKCIPRVVKQRSVVYVLGTTFFPAPTFDAYPNYSAK